MPICVSAHQLVGVWAASSPCHAHATKYVDVFLFLPPLSFGLFGGPQWGPPCLRGRADVTLMLPRQEFARGQDGGLEGAVSKEGWWQGLGACRLGHHIHIREATVLDCPHCGRMRRVLSPVPACSRLTGKITFPARHMTSDTTSFPINPRGRAGGGRDLGLPGSSQKGAEGGAPPPQQLPSVGQRVSMMEAEGRGPEPGKSLVASAGKNAGSPLPTSENLWGQAAEQHRVGAQ